MAARAEADLEEHMPPDGNERAIHDAPEPRSGAALEAREDSDVTEG